MWAVEKTVLQHAWNLGLGNIRYVYIYEQGFFFFFFLNWGSRSTSKALVFMCLHPKSEESRKEDNARLADGFIDRRSEATNYRNLIFCLSRGTTEVSAHDYIGAKPLLSCFSSPFLYQRFLATPLPHPPPARGVFPPLNLFSFTNHSTT